MTSAASSLPVPRIRRIDVSFNRRVPREISVRKAPLGGDILPSPDERPPGLFQRAGRLLLLVHGFNVNLCDAGCSYDHFARYLSIGWQARALPLYWPGDAATSRDRARNRAGIGTIIMSAFSYPFQPERAVRAAQVLADHIGRSVRERPHGSPALELNVVAHSLGCRLTLELLSLLGTLVEAGRLSIHLVVLMAAAVPRFMVRPDGLLRRALKVPGKVLLYHSRADGVLWGIFRSGQMLERPGPAAWRMASRAAIGRDGVGADPPRNVEQIPVESGHSGYWSEPAIAERIAAELEGKRRLDDLFRPLEMRRLSPARTIVFRVLGERRLPGDSGYSGLRAQCGLQQCKV